MGVNEDAYTNPTTGVVTNESPQISFDVTEGKITTATLVNNGSSTSNASQSLSYTATLTGGVPNGETVSLVDSSNNNTVVATGTTNGGIVNFTIPAGALLAGTHNLVAVYGVTSPTPAASRPQ